MSDLVQQKWIRLPVSIAVLLFGLSLAVILLIWVASVLVVWAMFVGTVLARVVTL